MGTKTSGGSATAGTSFASASEPQSYTRKDTGLVWEVRPADMFAFNASAATPVSIVLAIVVFAIFSSFPGANVILDFVLAAVLLPFIWITFSLMSAAMPGVGSDYLYGSRVLHPILGLFSNLCTYAGAILSVGLVAFLFVSVGIGPTLAAVGVIAHSQVRVTDDGHETITPTSSHCCSPPRSPTTIAARSMVATSLTSARATGSMAHVRDEPGAHSRLARAPRSVDRRGGRDTREDRTTGPATRSCAEIAQVEGASKARRSHPLV